MVMGITGLALVWAGSNWIVALGVFALGYAHNLERHTSE
jgi:hypothetical protein